jgi:hypothetical protein
LAHPQPSQVAQGLACSQVLPFRQSLTAAFSVIDKGGDKSLIGLAHAQKLLVNFVLTALIVRDEEEGDFPSPQGFFPLPLPWIGLCFVFKTFVLWLGSHVRGMRIKL